MGVVIGVLVACLVGIGLRTAEAQRARPQQYRECMSARGWHTSGENVNQGRISRTVRVPRGWTPIGGGGNVGGYTIFVMCR